MHAVHEGVQIVKAERINFPVAVGRPRVEEHRLTVNELLVVVRGDYTLTTADGEQHGAPGSVFVVPAGLTHRGVWRHLGRPPRSTTDFFLVQWHGVLPAPRPPLHVRLPMERVRVVCVWILDAMSMPGPLGERVAGSLLQSLLLETARQGGERDELVQIVDALIDQTHERQLRLDDLAAAAGLSRYHFLRRFKQAIGLTPLAYVRARRLDAVHRDLLFTDDSVAELARRYRFASPQHLATLLRERFGLTASQIRAAPHQA